MLFPLSEDAGDRQVQETPQRIPVPSLEEGQPRSNHASRPNVVHDREEILELSPLKDRDRYTSTVKDRQEKNAASESEDSAGYVHKKRHGRHRHRRRSYSISDSDSSELEYRQVSRDEVAFNPGTSHPENCLFTCFILFEPRSFRKW